MEQARNYLVAYPKLEEVIEFKTHLDSYSTCLVSRDHLYRLLFISNEVLRICKGLTGYPNPADNRGEECAPVYLDLEKSLQAINNNPAQELSYRTLRAIQVIMQGIKAKSTKAYRGLWNRSFLHEKLISLVDQFDGELALIKDQVDQKKKETIAQITAECEQNKATFDEKHAQMEEKQTKLQAENADLKVENAELKAEHVQKIAAMEAKQAEMEIKHTQSA